MEAGTGPAATTTGPSRNPTAHPSQARGRPGQVEQSTCSGMTASLSDLVSDHGSSPTLGAPSDKFVHAFADSADLSEPRPRLAACS
ncbi:hypothetical protein GCM10027289_06030 [Tsukamurella serpentis]